MSQPNTTPVQTNRIKACLFTLIIYTHDNRRSDYFKNLIRMIIEKFPCRIIFIEADADAAHEHLETSSSEETITTGDILISCDQFTIKAGGKLAERVPFIILPLIVPDLPIYLLWGEDPTMENAIFTALQKFRPHIIFDCDIVHNIPVFSQRLLEQFQHATTGFIDMKWVTIAGWRNILAQTFDNPESIDKLGNAKTIKITYNGKLAIACQDTHMQATYLQAWLAARLHWSLTHREEETHTNSSIRLTYINSKKHAIAVELMKMQREELAPGLILQIEIVFEDETTYLITRREKIPVVTVHITSQDACCLPFNIPLPNLQHGISFMKEIFYASHSEHYQHMLELLATYPSQPCN